MFPKILRSLSPIAFVAAAFALIAPVSLLAQAGSPLVTTRLTQPIDENARVTLKGTVHPLARAANDRGAAPDSMPLDRLTLVLKRSDAQESALRQLITDLHTPGSASYHKWLTPDQFGKQFGPSDQDLATVQSWLASHGFTVAKVNGGRQSLEISGNVAQFRSTFHSQIHKYAVNGEIHYANSTDPQIPAALAPVVAGFASINNFRLKSYVRKLGEAAYEPKTGKTTPQWTIGSAASGYSFVLSPADYAVQYDLNPLYSANTTGTGQTIAIVNDSNINIYLVNQFRSLFSLPANPPQVIIDGNDPGIDGTNNPDGPNGDSVEAYLDVEWSGAVAPNATIDLVVAADTAIESGLILALEHAIYGNVAPIVSLSFGGCEAAQGTFNQFISGIYEQAAAQGQTVIASTGDSGSANCDDDNTQYYAVNGQNVSGLASTPYNVAVGGTDFYYSAWNQGSSAINDQLMTYWKSSNGSFVTSNNTPAVSILGVIPEQPWNDSQFGLNIIPYQTGEATTIAGGGGGASNCVTFTSDGNCLAGYSKPAWQSGTGVPSDGVRDLPDLSLFAADGSSNASFYPICATDGDCQPVPSSGTVQIFGVGGTSASAPSFAGIMALVNQKYGRQGQANFVLYPLAAQFPPGSPNAAFNDVKNGTNSVPCNITSVANPNPPPFTLTPNDCISVSPPNDITITDPTYGTATEGQIGTGATPQYNATTGYDLASGLGTIDANHLVTNWGSVTFATSSVTLTSPTHGTSYTHGTAVNVSATVTGNSPTGDVVLLTDSTQPGSQSVDFFSLANGTASGSTIYLPGGTYDVWAHYGGDTKNAQADSAKAQITVNPEGSGIYLVVLTPDPNGGWDYIPSGTGNIPYGTQFQYSAQVAPSSKLSQLIACFTSNTACPVFPSATGVVTFSDSGTKVNTAVLNAESDAEYNPTDPNAAHIATNVGSHSITASYAGDSSYNASTASAITYTVVKGTPAIYSSSPVSITYAGQALTITVFVDSQGVGVPPTGTITTTGFPSGTPTSEPLSLVGIDPQTGATASYANFTIPASAASAGTYNFTLNYGGDTNYTSASASGSFSISPASPLKPSTTTITTTSSSTSPTALVGITITVTGQGSVAPTGTITLQVSGDVLSDVYTLTQTGPDTSAVQLDQNSSGAAQGANILIAAYSGDANYAASSSGAVNIANQLSDFSIIPQTTIVPVTAGSSGTDTINLYSVNGFSGNVTFSCKGTTVTCSVSTSASLSPGSTAPLTLTISAASSVATGNYNVLVTGVDSTGTYIHTLAIDAAVTATAPTFALSAAPTTLSLVAGATTGNTSTITATPSNGFTGDVNLTYTVSSPSGATSPPTVTFATNPIDIAGTMAETSVATVATTATTTAGTYTITVTGTNGSLTPTATITVTVTAPATPTFSVTAAPTTLSFDAGATSGNTSTITVTPVNGFTGNVPLSCVVTSPAGATSPATCSLNPPSANITGTSAVTSTLTVATTATTTAGTYTVAVTGTAGSITQTANVTVTVIAPTFTLSAAPTTLSFIAGAATGNTSTISVTPANGFTGNVPLACAATTIPAGATSLATCSLNPDTVDVTGTAAVTSVLTIASTATTTPGSYVFTIVGATGVISSQTTVTVTITAPPVPGFSLSASPTSLSLIGGATTGNTSTLTATPVNGFTGNVALTYTVSGPAGSSDAPTVTFATSPIPITGPAAGTSVATVATTSSTTPGNYTITVTGTSGSLTPTATITVTVLAPTFALTNSGSITVTEPNSGTSTITATPANGFTGSVALTCAVSPSAGGVGCSLNPTTADITGATAVTSTLTVTSGASSAALDHPLNKFFAIGGGATLAMVLFFGIPARRRSWRTMLGVLVFAAIVGLGIGCGSSGNKSTSYTVTVTGTSGTITQTTTVNVTVNSK
jgi:trimeric autotransporter adhesin